MRLNTWLTILLAASLLPSARAETALWQLASERAGVSLPVLVEQGDAPVRGVLISLETGNGQKLLRPRRGVPGYGEPDSPVARNRASLVAMGVVVLTPGLPSDLPKGFPVDWRLGADHRADLLDVVREAHTRFPGVPVVVHGYQTGASSALNLAEARAEGVDGYVITAGALQLHRSDVLERIRSRGLVIQPVSHNCMLLANVEAREVAAAAHWQYLPVGDSAADAAETCLPGSRAGLAAHDEAFATALARWITAGAVPATLGQEAPAVAYQERVFMIPGARWGLFGRERIELSVLTPSGEGPFPLVIYNHGDIPPQSANITRQARYRDMYVADVFLSLGFAVVMPARPGVGRSEGRYEQYQGAGGIYLGPATGLLQKGRDQLAEGLAALDFLRTLPEVDATRVVMAGQSAGGFAVSCLGGEVPPAPWLKAVVNFSGGRTDGIRDHLNAGMVSAFAYLGRTSRVPSLWIFAEHDSRYSVETIRASYAAFTGAGGVASLHLYPPIKGDGHFIYHQPQIWREDLRQFLAVQGLTAVPPFPAPPVPAEHAEEASQENG